MCSVMKSASLCLVGRSSLLIQANTFGIDCVRIGETGNFLYYCVVSLKGYCDKKDNYSQLIFILTLNSVLFSINLLGARLGS
jgi:hypothetical protein